jgi:DNA-binding SARP family transcriptional activator/tetratricopeptide (TPR) repeat protein
MEARCYLKTMGYPELRTLDGRLVRLKVRKHLALLVYFAVEGRTYHRREKLVDLLWSGVPIANGRHSLSMALTVLRSILGPGAIRSSASQVKVLPGAVTLDLERLFAGEVYSAGDALPLEVAGFLQEFEIADAPAFQDWRDRQQAQLLPSIQAGLLAMIDHARRSGEMPRVMTLAERLLALDPLAEEGIRARMEASALRGDRLGALRIYETWKEVLKNELGAAPSELLEGIATRLRTRAVTPAREPLGPAVQTEQWADRCFVGRQAEYQVLFDAWEATTQLNTRHVLITGDTGIGKSTLAMRFGSAAALEGAAVARVQCFELEQRIAFGMIGAIVTGLLDRPGAVATAPASLAEIARVVPRVRERFTSLPDPRQTEGEAARLHFAEGTFALFDAIMEEQPLVLIVDDYPRSDEASLSVLHMMLRRMANRRVMVVLTGRPPEADESQQSARIRNGISYLPMVRLDLKPLTESESEALLTAIVGRAGKTPQLPERRAILSAAGGNPMAIELLTGDWAAHGDAAMAVSIPAMQAEVPAAALEAAAFDRVLERLLPALSPRTRAVLQLVTILGPRLNDPESLGLLGFTPRQMTGAMTELIERRVLRDAGAGVEFTNELIRARLYLRIPAAVRRRLHGAVAESLLARTAAEAGIPGLEVAWHCIRARRGEEATPFLMTGAREAIMHGAPDEAARALSSALRQLKGRARDEATVLLAETYQEMARWEEALHYLRQLDLTSDPQQEQIAEILRIESKRQLHAFEVSELEDRARALIARIRGDLAPTVRARAALVISNIVCDLRDQSVFEEAWAAVHELTLDHFSTWERSKVLLAKARTTYHMRRQDSGLREAMETASLLEQAGATDSTFVRTHTGFGAIACAQGRYHDGLAPLERAYLAACRLDNPLLMCQAAYNRAVCLSRIGDPEEHRHWAILAREASNFLAPGMYERAAAATQVALASLSLQSYGPVEEVLEFLDAECKCGWNPWILQSTELFKADLNWLLGRKKVALGAVRKARAISGEALDIGFVGTFARWGTLLHMKEGNAIGAWEELRQSYELLPRLDAKDRADILCSIFTVGTYTQVPVPDIASQAREALASLPARCAQEMISLGLRLPS